MQHHAIGKIDSAGLLETSRRRIQRMPSAEFLIDKLGEYAERFEEVFETRFERVARNPRVLAFVGSSLNFASAMRIESRKLGAEAASFRARAKLAFVSHSKAQP